VEVFAFVRFHAAAGNESAVEEALRDVLRSTREEEGCMSIHAFRGMRDPQIFYIHSKWESEEAFNVHSKLPHVAKFLERMDTLIDRPREATRTKLID
jgi:quinol monooxygenase YgiN